MKTTKKNIVYTFMMFTTANLISSDGSSWWSSISNSFSNWNNSVITAMRRPSLNKIVETIHQNPKTTAAVAAGGITAAALACYVYNESCKADAQIDLNMQLLAAVRDNAAPQVIQDLLDRGANITADIWGYNPLEYAVKNGNIEIADLLVRNGAPVNMMNRYSLLRLAVSHDRIDMAQWLLDHGANINAIDGRYKLTPLHHAIERGTLDMTKLLLANGADVNATSPDRLGETPLHIAARNVNIDLTKLLLENGAHVNAVDINGYIPLHYAVGTSRFDTINLLLDHGANINATDNHRHMTPLHYAARNRNSEIIKLLLDRGADAYLVNSDGQTAKDIATQWERQDNIDLLQDWEDMPTVKGVYGEGEGSCH